MAATQIASPPHTKVDKQSTKLALQIDYCSTRNSLPLFSNMQPPYPPLIEASTQLQACECKQGSSPIRSG